MTLPTPLSENGATALPMLPLVEKTTVSSSGVVTPPALNSNRSVSPSVCAYSVICQIDSPTYGPNGTVACVGCTPRTSVPTNAVKEPDT